MLRENGKKDFLIKRKCCSASVGKTVLRRVENVTRNGSSFRQNSAPCSYNPTQLYHRPPTLRPAIRARGRSFNIYLCKTASLSSPATFLTGAEHAIDAIDALHVKAHLQVFNWFLFSMLSCWKDKEGELEVSFSWLSFVQRRVFLVIKRIIHRQINLTWFHFIFIKSDNALINLSMLNKV